MRQILVFFSICFTTVLIQSLLFVRLSAYILGVVPQLTVIIIALFGITYGRLKSQFLGISAGLFYDLLSSSPIGYHVLLFFLISVVSGFLYNKIYVENIPMAIIFIAIITFLEYLLASGIDYIFGIDSVYVEIFSLKFLLELLINSIFVVILFPAFRFLAKKLSYSWQQWERRD